MGLQNIKKGLTIALVIVLVGSIMPLVEVNAYGEESNQDMSENTEMPSNASKRF